jgi:hypothetical protein
LSICKRIGYVGYNYKPSTLTFGAFLYGTYMLATSQNPKP